LDDGGTVRLPDEPVLQGSALDEPVPYRGLPLCRDLGPNAASRPVNRPANRLTTAFFAPVHAQTAGSRRRFRPMRQKTAGFSHAEMVTGRTSPVAAFCGIVEVG
jgi:hypothetical protein